MLSAEKSHLAIAERVAIIAAAACVATAALCRLDESFAKFALPIVLFALAVMFYFALLIAGLTKERLQALGKLPSPSGEPPESTIHEIRRQLQWSPRVYRFSALVALAGIVATAFVYGTVSWSTDEVFTQHHAIGASLYLCCMLLLELPFIASASRMPGTFQENASGSGLI
jgi:hypothetical protein